MATNGEEATVSAAPNSANIRPAIPRYFFVVTASLLIALALIGSNHIRDINANNASIRIDRAGRSAAALIDASIDDVAVMRNDQLLPTSIAIDPSHLEPSESFNELLDTIAGANQGAANIFRLNDETNSYDRIGTTFRDDEGARIGNTTVEPGLIGEGHPAFADLRAGNTFVGNVPVAGRLRLAYLTPLVDSAQSPIGILAVDVGFVDDLDRINAEGTRNALLLIALLLAVVALATILFLRHTARPLYRLIGLANDLGSRDSDAIADELVQQSETYSGRNDEIGALARGLGKVGGLRSQLEHQAYFDALTKLPNRSSMWAEISRRFALPDHGEFAVSILGIDGFKKVNDSLGQHAGDELLVAFADRLQNAVRDDEYLARLGGDEFAIITPVSPHHEDWAKELNQRISFATMEPFTTSAGETRISSTTGSALVPRDGANTERIMANADLALNDAKRRVRGSFQVFEARLAEGFDRQMQLLPELQRAVGSDNLEMVFQPIFDRAGRVRSVEGLTRWNHPTLGVVAPDEFIPLAESSGLISSIGEWSLEYACRQLKEWSKDLAEVPSISVNISTMYLQHPDFIRYIARLFQVYPDARGKLTIEVDEALMVDIDSEWHRSILRQLASLGTMISIDDFANGYGSLSSLGDLEIDEIKIDQKFVAMAAENPGYQQLLRGMVALLKRLDLTVVLQGIETREGLALLSTTECDSLQGFALAKPMSAEQAVEFFNSTHPAIIEQVASSTTNAATRSNPAGTTPPQGRPQPESPHAVRPQSPARVQDPQG